MVAAGGMKRLSWGSWGTSWVFAGTACGEGVPQVLVHPVGSERRVGSCRGRGPLACGRAGACRSPPYPVSATASHGESYVGRWHRTTGRRLRLE